MRFRLACSILLLSLAAACGDNIQRAEPDAEPPPPDATPSLTCDEGTLADSLAMIPGVTAVVEAGDCGPYVLGAARCFNVLVDQPVQHAAPEGPQFSQSLWLIHRSCDAPTVVADWGYSNDLFYDMELTLLYQANALWIEHRYQGASVPTAENWDWTALTIENGATDMHRIVSGFRTLYPGRWVSTGASKGGITATYHKYFFPDDVDGSVPYVAPASRARIDPEYQTYLDTTLPNPCAQRIRNVQVAALTTRRAMMLDRIRDLAGPGQEDAILESLTDGLDWGFWQYWGYSSCADVPVASTATNAAFWQFYLDYSYLAFASPGPGEAYSYGALSYEWLTEQGFALQTGAHIADLIVDPQVTATMEDNFRAEFPSVTLPAHDGTVTLATRDWVRDTAEDVLLIYGQYDPWSGGAMDTPAHPTSGRFFVPAATHGAEIGGLAPADEAAALALATPMFGRDPADDLKPAARIAGAFQRAIVERKLMEYLAHQALRR